MQGVRHRHDSPGDWRVEDPLATLALLLSLRSCLVHHPTSPARPHHQLIVVLCPTDYVIPLLSIATRWPHKRGKLRARHTVESVMVMGVMVSHIIERMRD